jgi:hypothetical protein
MFALSRGRNVNRRLSEVVLDKAKIVKPTKATELFLLFCGGKKINFRRDR